MLVPKMSVARFMRLTSIGHGKNIAIQEGERKIERRELLREVNWLAKALVRLNVRPGDIVMVTTAEPRWETIVIFLAANQIGAVVMIVDEKKPAVIQEKLRLFAEPQEIKNGTFEPGFDEPLRLNPIKIVFSEKRLEKLSRPEGFDGLIVSLHVVHEKVRREGFYTFGEMMTLDAQMDGKAKFPKIASIGKAPALVSLVGEDASIPVVFTNEALIAATLSEKKMTRRYSGFMGLCRFDCLYGFWNSAVVPILSGATAILRPAKCSILEATSKLRPQVIMTDAQALKAMKKEMYQLEPWSSLDFASVKLVVMECKHGEKCAKTCGAVRSMLERIHYEPGFYNYYRVEEMPAAISIMDWNSRTGRVANGLEVRIIDPQAFGPRPPRKSNGKVIHRDLTFIGEGVVLVKGKGLTAGYVSRPELDGRFIKLQGDTYFVTGDLGELSEDGKLTIYGRADFAKPMDKEA